MRRHPTSEKHEDGKTPKGERPRGFSSRWADLSSRIGGISDDPLSEACRQGNCSEVFSLLEANDPASPESAMALQTAVIFNSTDVARLLISEGVDLHLERETPLQLAAACHNREMIRLLLDFGADAATALAALREKGGDYAAESLVLAAKKGELPTG